MKLGQRRKKTLSVDTHCLIACVLSHSQEHGSGTLTWARLASWHCRGGSHQWLQPVCLPVPASAFVDYHFSDAFGTWSNSTFINSDLLSPCRLSYPCKYDLVSYSQRHFINFYVKWQQQMGSVWYFFSYEEGVWCRMSEFAFNRRWLKEEMVSSCAGGCLDWIWKKHSSLKGLSSTGIGCPLKWLSHHPRKHVKYVDVAHKGKV